MNLSPMPTAIFLIGIFCINLAGALAFSDNSGEPDWTSVY